MPERQARDAVVAVPLYKLKAEFFKTLGHPARIRVLELLSEREHAVAEMLPEVGIEPAHLSQQLAVLRHAGLVTTRREGTTVFYSCVSEHVARLVTDAVHNAEHREPGVPAHHRTDPGVVALPTAAEGSR